jgi:glycosyltransferase involved in cell wall biosynthesis
MTKISVICPTYNRHHRHANLYTAFNHQINIEAELLILDDSPTPSPFFLTLSDPRVNYQHLSKRMTIGSKRNLLIEKASGEIIAHFDDDDFYAPSYLFEMNRQRGQADFITLSKWLAWRERDGSLWEWDTEIIMDNHFMVEGDVPATLLEHFKTLPKDYKIFNDETLWGYGFSYVYRKALWQAHPFADKNHGEDYDFVHQARLKKFMVLHTSVLSHLALHIIHQNGTSRIFPQYQLNSSEAFIRLGETAAPWLILPIEQQE